MAEDDSLLREVQEEIRREQLQKIWDRYNGLIIGAAAALVLGVGAYKMIESRRMAAAETAGAQYAAAENLNKDLKKDEAAAAFAKIAANGPSGYAALAKLQLAGSQVKAGKTADAVATYDELAKQSGTDALLKSFAQLQAASLRLDDADFAEIQNRLTPLTADGQPFSKSARELLGIAAYKAKKYHEARNYLEPLLIDPNASGAMQERIKIVMGDIASAETGGAAPQAASKSGDEGTKTDDKATATGGTGSTTKR